MKKRGVLFGVLSLTVSAWLVGFTASPALAISFTGEYFNVAHGAAGTEGNGGVVTGLSLGLLTSTSLTAGGFPAFAQNFWSTTNPSVTKDALGVAAPTGPNGGGLHVDAAINFGSNFFAGAVGTTPGGNDSTFYRAVHWTSLFSAPGPVSFTLAADDHAWLFIDGVLRVDDGGIKAIGGAQPSGPLALGPGNHTLDLFFADAFTFQSGVILTADGVAEPISNVPEPATLILLGTTLVGLGSVMRRRMSASTKAEA